MARRHAAALPWVDAILPVMLCVGTVVYLAAFPLLLRSPDEAKGLNEARRLLGGELMYRDIFDIITPGWQYLMAALFGLFGTTLRTARIAVAVIHGLSVALVFVACRRLGVRTALACAAGLAYLVLAQPAFPDASYHWLATLLTLLLLFVCLEMRGRAAPVFAAGVLVGSIVMVHQHRGLSLGIAVGLIVVADGWFHRRAAAGGMRSLVMRNLAALAAGVLAVVVPLGIALVVPAGIDAVWQSLVVFPVTQYRAVNYMRWGGWLFAKPPVTIYARLLPYSPLAIGVVGAGAALHAWRTRDAWPIRMAVVLAVFSLFSIVSILYYPDLIHIGLVVPVLLVAFAAGVEWLLSALPARPDALVGGVSAVGLILACGWQLQRNLPGPLGDWRVMYDSHFGRLPMHPSMAAFHTQLAALLDGVPERTLYRYPASWYTYLLVGAHNPTRYEFILPGYHTRQQMEEVVASLRTADVPYVMIDTGRLAADDPVYAFIKEHYEPLTDAGALSGVVWRRKRTAGAHR